MNNPIFSKVAAIMSIIMAAVIVILAASFVFYSCGFIPKGEVIYTSDGEKSIYHKTAFAIYEVDSGVFSHVNGADVATFEALTSNIGKDKDHVYSGSDKQPDIDADTFEITADGILKDKNYVYFDGLAFELKPVIGADIETYRELGLGVAKDKSNIFYFGKLQDHVDYKTFKFSEEDRTAEDKYHTYQLDWAYANLKIATTK